MDIPRARRSTPQGDALQQGLWETQDNLNAMQDSITKYCPPAVQTKYQETRRATDQALQAAAGPHPKDNLSRVLGGLRYKHKHFMVSAGGMGTYTHASQRHVLPAETAAPVGPQPNLLANLHAVRQGLKGSLGVEVQLGSFDAIPPGVSFFTGAKHRRNLQQFDGEVGWALPSGEPYGRLGSSRILFKGAQGTFPFQAFGGDIQVHGSLGMRKNDPNGKAHLQTGVDILGHTAFKNLAFKNLAVKDLAVQVRAEKAVTHEISAAFVTIPVGLARSAVEEATALVGKAGKSGFQGATSGLAQGFQGARNGLAQGIQHIRKASVAAPPPPAPPFASASWMSISMAPLGILLLWNTIRQYVFRRKPHTPLDTVSHQDIVASLNENTASENRPWRKK